MDWKDKIEKVLASGVSKADIARECGYTAPWVNQVLTGKVKNIGWNAGQALIRLERRALRQAVGESV